MHHPSYPHLVQREESLRQLSGVRRAKGTVHLKLAALDPNIKHTLRTAHLNLRA